MRRFGRSECRLHPIAPLGAFARKLMPRSRILIVDDERVIADSLAVIFEKQGYQARAAHSAEQAIEIVSQWHPDLAILDVILPGRNGIDLAILIKSGYPDIAVMDLGPTCHGRTRRERCPARAPVQDLRKAHPHPRHAVQRLTAARHALRALAALLCVVAAIEILDEIFTH
jgi:CheY-like chemotaxis protein